MTVLMCTKPGCDVQGHHKRKASKPTHCSLLHSFSASLSLSPHRSSHCSLFVLIAHPSYPPLKNNPVRKSRSNSQSLGGFSANQMEFQSYKLVIFMLLGYLSTLQSASGIRFVIDREECFSHSVQYEGDTVHVSFVVIKADAPWNYGEEGVDFVVKGPSGDHIHDFRDKTSDKFEFVAHTKGIHQFCFTNKSPYHETIDFDVHVGHFTYVDQHAKDEHFNPLLEQIEKLEESLYNIQFEQHWLEAQTDRQAIVNDAMSKRAIHKAIFESVALIGASVLQFYLLRRLFERKLGTSRV